MFRMLSRLTHTSGFRILAGGIALVLALIGSYFSADIAHWWWHVGTISSAVIIGVFIARLLPPQGKIVTRLIGSISLTLVISAGLAYLAANFGWIDITVLDGAIGGRNAVAAGVAFNALSTILLFPQRKITLSIVATASLIAIGNLPILIGGAIAFVFANALLASIDGKSGRRRELTVIGLFIVVTIGIVWITAQSGMQGASLYAPTTEAFPNEQLNQAREVAFAGFLEAPFTGHGLFTFPNYFADVNGAEQLVAHPHSSILLILYEQGIIGALVILLLLSGVLFSSDRVSVLALFLGIFVLFLSSTDATFYHALVFYPFWFSINLVSLPYQREPHIRDLRDDSSVMRVQRRELERTQAIADIVILAIAVAFMAQLFILISPEPSTSTWMVAGISATVWGFFSFIPVHTPGGYRSGFQMYFVPIVATVVLVIAFLVAGVPLPFIAVATYFAITQLGFLFSRFVLRGLVPNVQVHLVGRSELWAELQSDRRLNTSQLNTPSHLVDYIVVGSNPDGDVEHVVREYTSTQSQAAIITDYQAAEVFHGRILPAAVQKDRMRARQNKVKRYAAVKRTLDTALIIVASPFILLLLGVTALVVLITSGRPVFYSQMRVGKDNKPFRIYKIRTMRTDAELQGAQFAASEDERVTTVGRILRGFRLDEIPQFWNVLKGDMSIIGPRPEQVTFVEDFEEQIPFYGVRHSVRPGITGWAQVNQGYAAGTDETFDKLSYDLFYIKHFSIWLDLLIVGRTITTILTKFGAK